MFQSKRMYCMYNEETNVYNFSPIVSENKVYVDLDEIIDYFLIFNKNIQNDSEESEHDKEVCGDIVSAIIDHLSNIFTGCNSENLKV